MGAAESAPKTMCDEAPKHERLLVDIIFTTHFTLVVAATASQCSNKRVNDSSKKKGGEISQYLSKEAYWIFKRNSLHQHKANWGIPGLKSNTDQCPERHVITGQRHMQTEK